MPYRDNKPIDPESLRPELTFWQRQRVKNWDSFFGLCSEQWFREWCGGVWLKGEELYNFATCSNTTDTTALFFWPTRDSIGYNRFKMCEWIPLIQVEGNPSCFYMYYQPDDVSKQQLMIIVDVLSEKLLMEFFNPKNKRWIEVGSLDKWLKDRLEVYQHSLKIYESIRFEPSVEALLNTWPDYWHMRQLGIIKCYGEK